MYIEQKVKQIMNMLQLKKLTKKNLKKTILNEIKIMKELKSENSVLLIDSIETNDSNYLVLELC